jgi:tRNA dimethylallyltransferase
MSTGKVICIFGPTASGKTGFTERLAHYIPIEIINMDSAQMYTVGSIGTAKPDWRNSPIKQHMFDIIDQPMRMTAHAYVGQVRELVPEILARGATPVLVGGSGFYLKSILFPQQSSTGNSQQPCSDDNRTAQQLWQQLHTIDPVRASEIHPHDRYRIVRALEIWHTTGSKPSLYKPTYAPPWPYTLVHIYKQKDALHAAIDERLQQMIACGWVQEAAALINTPWQDFVTQKGFIGYTELIAYVQGKITLEQACTQIAFQTKQYAKRQETFWRMVHRDVVAADSNQARHILEFDLTSIGYDLYIKQLLNDLITL